MFASLIALIYRCKAIHSKLILKAHESSLITFISITAWLRLLMILSSRQNRKRVNPRYSEPGKQVQLAWSYANRQSHGRRDRSQSR